ncbi:MAG: type I methionyl aminopeptidase [Candidatus Omnitrophica bacterium]|nr:type I methionyl aminopeptidase [Candidatus Omnitrophota bacterium]
MIELKTPGQIERMRQAGRVVGEVLAELRVSVGPGVTTLELDELARATMARLGARPAFKGYRGFPAHICASVNEQVVHGIPSGRALREGDIVGLDVGAVVDGYYGDAAVTLPVGAVSGKAQELMRVTEQALERGIGMARPGGRLSDISHAVQAEVESHGFSVVREFVGHGIGTQLHEAPQIPNYGKPGFGPELKPGMVLAIEPMVNQGAAAVRILEDGWTAVTVDGSLSAHFEHTVAIGEDGPEILTRR